MGAASNLMMFGRFAAGYRRFLKQTITLEEAGEIMKRRMAEREAGFLRLVEKGVFGYRKSPYLPLLKMAGCELADVRDTVKTRGLEATLLALREAGVYITFEEFRGHEPIVRSGKVFPVEAHDFDNPFLRSYYKTETSGSTGAGIRISTDLDHLAEQAVHLALANEAHGLSSQPVAIWHSTLPNGAGLNNVLRYARCGHVADRWYSFFTPRELKPAPVFRLAMKYVIGAARFHGVPLPRPQPVSLDDAGLIARWAVDKCASEGACVIRTNISCSLRISLAAREMGLDLSGTTFIAAGEPVTPAKVAGIEASGAGHLPTYPFMEAGLVGYGCASPFSHDDVHLLKDMMALIQYPRSVPGHPAPVEAFNFTTLFPTAPKLMLNVELDDYGIVETRSCGCPLGEYGLDEHLREIRSFRKLTGEGVTLVGSEMIRILEEVLPARFGGRPLDYQLMEEEDERGFTRMSLLVSPKVELADENAVLETVLEELGKGGFASSLAGTTWLKAGSLRLKRMEPVWTDRGKLATIHSNRGKSKNNHDPE